MKKLLKKIVIVALIIFFIRIIATSFDNFLNIKDYFSNTFIKEKLVFYIVSINDYNYNVDIEGNIEKEIDFKIPYKIPESQKIDLTSYKEVVNLSENDSKEKEDNVKLIFSYPEQKGLSGEGYINAKLKIDDEKSNIPDNKFKTRQLNIENENEYTLAQFLYPRNLKYNQYGILEIKVISGIKDKMFFQEQHLNRKQKYIYYPVMSPTTGMYWLNNNLGSNYSNVLLDDWSKNPFQQAKSIVDKNAYGNLFQWGRISDGHELRARFEKDGFTYTKSDNPKHKLHIISNDHPYDWRENEDNSLWNSENINNICPIGWKVPTKEEFLKEFDNNYLNDNFLKLTLSGYRLNHSNEIYSEGKYGNYWLNEITDSYAGFLLVSYKDIKESFIPKASSSSVRCIKE